LHRLDRTSLRLAHSFYHFVGASQQGGGIVSANVFAVLCPMLLRPISDCAGLLRRCYDEQFSPDDTAMF
jgi:hypothetical protein